MWQQVSKNFLLTLTIVTLSLGVINFVLLLNITRQIKQQPRVSAAVEEKDPKDLEIERLDKLAFHIERLVVLDQLFNDGRQTGRDDISLEELMVIESLFKSE